jgi:hypothetical protein
LDRLKRISFFIGEMMKLLRMRVAGLAVLSLTGSSGLSQTPSTESDTPPPRASTVVGKETEVVVTTESPLLVSDRAEIPTTLTTREEQALPILDRNVTNLVPAIPGAQLNWWQQF